MVEKNTEQLSEENESQTKKPIFDRLIQIYDQAIVNNPDWLHVKDCEKVFGIGDRTVRNYAKKGNWKKKYAKVDGTPLVFFLKDDVYKYLKANGLIDESKIEEALSRVPSEKDPEKGTETPLETPPTTQESLIDPKSLPASLKKAVEEAFQVVHKDTIKDLKDTKEMLSKVEKSRMAWLTNTFWAIGAGLIVAGFLTYLFMNAKNLAADLSNKYTDLSSKYENSQSELMKAKDAILEKEELLVKTQSNAQGK